PRTPGYLGTKEASRWRGAWAAWAGGVGYFAVSLSWIVEPFLVDVARHGWMAPFALVFMAGGLALFWALAGWLGAGRVLIFVVALAGAEMVRGHVFTGFPWALPAYIWAETPVRMVASLVGPYGLTVLTLALVALPLVPGRAVMGSVLSVLAFAALGLWGFANGPDPEIAGTSIGTVRLVQPNAPQEEKWDPERAHIFVERQIGFTAAPKDGVDLIVWPETALPYRLDRAAPVLGQIAGAAEGVPVVTGINRSEAGRNHNSLIVVGANGQAGEVYDKVHLVPFGEYIPFGQVARLVGLRSFAARDGYGFSPGEAVRLIDTPLGRALPLICYEAIFPGHGRGLERPDFLLQITNDAWFGTVSGPFQHLDQARFRAVEQGLPLVRVANTGVSAVIDATGEVIEFLPLGEAGFFDTSIPRGRAATVYARSGDIPVAIFLLVTLTALTVAARRNGIAKAT
ncbi:MAG: apolipoprotein N-acyltransferase, partial [Boseongicola sp.]|nr:apolipoprotein N-acyltransferase [Boseongicola sp.]